MFSRYDKRALSAAGLQHPSWILRDGPYPPNIWEALSPEQHGQIMAGRDGAERLSV
jgi:hypothetical protein